ncbi:hypothetical protein [Methyloceanibacter caenitepidi]|uniref:Uncharacterized protein n=1 Tax=Methyloceanibacter caenitepidi TaxID=1384459 RepID=A0A0A8JZ72_9HYPH|nr:hypothetical protein [Methyloceanibacter caenitepidi]BAQ16108.1 hypothetical protein GL4_0645 [Methyloceanibacter caenitepidi]
MPQIINAFRGTSPIAETIRSLSGTLLGSPGDQTSDALKREQLYAAQRENVETDNYGRQIAEGGADTAWRSPVAQAMLFASGRNAGSTQGAFNANQSRMAAQHAASLAESRRASEAALTENARQFNQTPLEALQNGAPVFVPRAGAFEEGVSPVLSDAERKGTLAGQNFGSFNKLPIEEQTYLGADPSAAKPGATWNYIADGKSYLTNDQAAARGVDLNGNPLPAGGYKGTVEGAAGDVGVTGKAKIDNDLLTSRTNTDIAVNAIDGLSAKLQTPDAGAAIGVLGQGARLFNDVRAQIEAAGAMFNEPSADVVIGNPESQAALDQGMNALLGDPETQSRLRQLGIDSSILRSNIQDLAYIIAKAQGGPADKLSENDVARAVATIGGSLQDPSAMVEVLADLKIKLQTQQAIRERNLMETFPGANFTPREMPAAPSPQAAPQVVNPGQGSGDGPVDWQTYFGGS